jgi:hypothetical protein
MPTALGGSPMFQPGQQGPIPGQSPVLPGTGKEPAPGNLSAPQLDNKAVQGTEK